MDDVDREASAERKYAVGLMQLTPETFARYHQDGTSWDPADREANVAATLNYTLARYGDLPRGYTTT